MLVNASQYVPQGGAQVIDHSRQDTFKALASYSEWGPEAGIDARATRPAPRCLTDSPTNQVLVPQRTQDTASLYAALPRYHSRSPVLLILLNQLKDGQGIPIAPSSRQGERANLLSDLLLRQSFSSAKKKSKPCANAEESITPCTIYPLWRDQGCFTA